MKGKTLRLIGVILVMAMVSGFVGTATANFLTCYPKCVYKCYMTKEPEPPEGPPEEPPEGSPEEPPEEPPKEPLQPEQDLVPCIYQCGKNCTQQLAPMNDNLYYCNIGCSIESCSGMFGDEFELERCVGDCSNNICHKLSA